MLEKLLQIYDVKTLVAQLNGVGENHWSAAILKRALANDSALPFFAPPQALIEVLHDDWPRLLDSLLHSLGLLGLGVLLGTSCGFISGLAIGWSHDRCSSNRTFLYSALV